MMTGMTIKIPAKPDHVEPASGPGSRRWPYFPEIPAFPVGRIKRVIKEQAAI
jgi:hypothetical protein